MESSIVYPDAAVPLMERSSPSALAAEEELQVHPGAALVAVGTAAAAPTTASGTHHQAQSLMHVYFQQFTGCRHGNMVPAPQVAPPDAHIMDLRSAVPYQPYCQFLDLEARHVPIDSDDSSGGTGSSGSEDGSSFIDDTPAEFSTADAIYIAKYMAKDMPITAAQLQLETRCQPSSPSLCPPKRTRPIITSSESELDEPSPVPPNATTRDVHPECEGGPIPIITSSASQPAIPIPLQLIASIKDTVPGSVGMQRWAEIQQAQGHAPQYLPHDQLAPYLAGRRTAADGEDIGMRNAVQPRYPLTAVQHEH